MARKTGAVIVAAIASTMVLSSGAVGQADPSAGAEATVGPVSSPRTGYASVNGLDMYYEVHGTGRPLVLLHGALVGIDISYRELIPTLAESRQVIAIEQQGHYHTEDIDRPLSYGQMAEDTAALLRELGVEQADVFGYSMGGVTALELAIRYPDLVRKLVVASAEFDPDGLYPVVLEDIERLRAEDFTGSGLPELYATVAPEPSGWPGLVERVKELATTFEGIPADAVAGITAPTMVVIGDSDAVTPEHAAELFRLLGGGVSGDNVGMPGDQLVVLPGLSHVGVAMAVPTWFVPTVLPFLDAPMPAAG